MGRVRYGAPCSANNIVSNLQRIRTINKFDMRRTPKRSVRLQHPPTAMQYLSLGKIAVQVEIITIQIIIARLQFKQKL